MIVWFFACSKVSGVPTSRKGSAFPRSLARESANVVLLGNDLERFAETLALARKTRGIMGQNFVGTIGFLNPLLAAGYTCRLRAGVHRQLGSSPAGT